MDEYVVDKNDEGAKTMAVFARMSTPAPLSKDLDSLLSDLSSMPSYVLIPEQERGELERSLTSASAFAFANYVAQGGVLVVAYAGAYASLFSSIFGWSLSSEGCSSTSLDLSEASGTVFDTGPSNLPSLNAVICVAKSSLPPGSRAVYRDGTAVSVFVAPYGLGSVVGLAPDWYSSSSEWDDVLIRAVSLANHTQRGQ
jgi:hypothetical protein